MKQKNKTRKKQSNIIDNKKTTLVFFILIIISTYLFYALYLLLKQPSKYFTVEKGSVSQEETDVGYIIRNEQVVKGNNYKNGMEQIKTEGDKTAKGESIYRYYSQNEEEISLQIEELEGKIQETLSNQTELFSSDIKLIENQIDGKIKELNKTNDVSKLEEMRKEITTLVTKKAKIAGDLSPSGSYLKELYNERNKLETTLNSGAEYVKAPISGIVSYRVDGLEETLTPSNFSVLSKQYLESLNLKTGKIVATNNECGKVIDNFSCYIATISNSNEAKNSKVGDKVNVRLSNNQETEAEIKYISQENENNTLVVLELTKQIKELINYRKVTIDIIWWNYSGLKVPNKAIIEENGINYVTRNKAGEKDKIPVIVVKQNEKNTIIKNYKTEELQELGFSNKQISSYKNISLHDELLLDYD